MAVSTTKSVSKREKKDINYPEEYFGKERVKTYIIGDGKDEPIVGCFNGHNWVVEVNKEVEIPVTIFDIIKETKRVIEESKKENEAFTVGAGKNMTGEI